MKLSLKATRFVIEALEHYQQHHDERLREERLPEDEASDLVNDRQYLEAIKQSFLEYRDSLMTQREGSLGEEPALTPSPDVPVSPG